MKDACQTCGRPIWWLAHVKSLKPAPIESAEPGAGNVVPMVGAGVTVAADRLMDQATHYRVIGVRKGEQVPATGYRSHFSTCPTAQHWRDREPALRKVSA